MEKVFCKLDENGYPDEFEVFNVVKGFEAPDGYVEAWPSGEVWLRPQYDTKKEKWTETATEDEIAAIASPQAYKNELEKQIEFNASLAQVVLSNANKEVLAIIESYIPEWEIGKKYQSGDLVAYDGKTYVAIMDTVATDKVKPPQAKTSYQEYKKSQMYLDGFGKVIKFRE